MCSANYYSKTLPTINIFSKYVLVHAYLHHEYNVFTGVKDKTLLSTYTIQ